MTDGLRDPAAARRHQHGERQRARGSRGCSPASPASIRTRARSRTSTRTCSARARSSARASTTSTRSSSALGGRFPENRILSHDLLEGAYARAGPGQRRGARSRTIPSTLRRRRQPAPPLDPRRLADRRVAAAPRAGRRAARVAQPDLAAVAVEDPRQPAPQPGADRAARAARSSAGSSRRRGVRDARGRARSCVLPGLLTAAAELARRPERAAARPARPRDRAHAWRGSSCARRSRWRACRTTPSSRSTRSRAPLLRAARHARKLLEWRTASDAAAQRARRASPARIASMWIAPAAALAVAVALGRRSHRTRCRWPRRCSRCGRSRRRWRGG